MFDCESPGAIGIERPSGPQVSSKSLFASEGTPVLA
jgi:hypothetical protein